MNISSATSTETCVFEKWNPFLVFESNSHKQFGEWEMITAHNNPNTTISTIPTTTNNHPFVPTPNFFNCITSSGGGGGNANMSSSFVSSYGGGSGGSSNTNTTSMNISYPKLSDYSMAAEFIGLDLGGRTYFSSQESAVIDRVFKRPRGFYLTNHVPRCQAQGCGMDLTNAKHYHKRHKVCEFHSKANIVLAGGLEQRFCQQCSRFQLLAEFDKGKRSCRKRLADHNRRRRKPPPPSLTKAADEKATSEVVKKASSLSSSSSRTSIICTNTFPSCAATAEGNNVPIIPHRIYGMSKEKPQQWQQESIFNDSSTMGLFERELLFSSFNEVTPPMGGNSQVSTQQQQDIQNLLHLDRAFFEGDLHALIDHV